MFEKPEISVIIVNYHSSESLQDCLSSLRGIGSISIEKIVYDNGGDDDGLAQVDLSDTRLISSRTNFGFGGACNRAVESANGDFLLFLNPDTLLRKGNIDAIVRKMRSNPSIGIIGPALVLSDGSSQPWSFGRAITPLGTIRNNIFPWLKRDRAVLAGDTPVDWVSGAALFIRKDLFNKLGGFDERFFMYFEDADLCRRVKARKLKILRSDAMEFEHAGGRSFEKSENLQKRYYYASQDAYFKKHFGPFQSGVVGFLRRLFT